MSLSTQTSRHRRVHELASLAEIQAPAYNLLTYPRPVIAPIEAFVTQLSRLEVPPLQQTLPVGEVAPAVSDHLSPFCRGHEAGFDALVTDIDRLARTFAEVADSPRLRLWFATVSDSMCRLFHTDAVALRLLCTYLGPGTLWVEEDNVNWDRMDEPSNEARVRDLAQVQQCAPFEVAILKGGMYDHNEGQAVLHRSPTVAEAGASRVLLRLDSQGGWL
jgi:hypothetical protein